MNGENNFVVHFVLMVMMVVFMQTKSQASMIENPGIVGGKGVVLLDVRRK